MVGGRIGSYEIRRELGRGGMGVVYLGHDVRLERDVAIKALPERFANDPGMLERLRREARLLASVNHANIATIYALEEHEQGQYLILEHIPGETLAERLCGGPLPLDEALSVGRQIALAVAAAHECGVIHRDLKPGNVMITPAGMVKVLDFGIAKASDTTGAGASASDSTVAMIGAGQTRPGGIIGTPGYMSPEQARGRTVDKRTDVWSFGCVLFECLCAEAVFAAETDADAIAAVLTADPAWSHLPSTTPDRVRSLLAHCLEKDPAARLRDLGDAALLIDESTGTQHAGLRTPARPRGGGNIPESATSFVGRASLLSELRSLLGDSRLVTLTGSGGCGKTRLALELGRAVSEEATPRDGTWLVELAALTDPTLAASTVARVLGVAEQPGCPALETLVNALVHMDTLIVLDNCEHVLHGCIELAARVLNECPSVRLVTTAREPLAIPGESVVRVPSLELPPVDDDSSPEAILDVEAVRLFVDRARAVRGDFEPTPSNALVLARICHRLDGIPLAIELAAARTRAMSVEEIERRLDDRFRLLTGGSRLALPRHQTLRAAVEWSFDLLEPPARRLLVRLSVFANGWTLDTAEAVCADDELDALDVLDLLTSLVDRSLVVHETRDDDSRYRLLETVRQYAAGAWPDLEDPAPLRRRHALHFAELGIDGQKGLLTDEQQAWLRRLDLENDNIRAALAFVIDHGDLTPALRLAASQWRYWQIRGFFGEGRGWLDRALARAADAPPSIELAGAYNVAGILASNQDDTDAAVGFYERSGRMYHDLGDELRSAYVRGNLGNLRFEQAKLEESLELHQSTLVTFREHGTEWDQAAASSNAARSLLSLDRAAEAIPLLEESLAIGERLGERVTLSSSHLALALAFCTLGERDQAEAHILRCFDELQEVPSHRVAPFAFEAAGNLLVNRAPDDEAMLRRAAVLFGVGDALRTRLGMPFTPRDVHTHESVLETLRTSLKEPTFEQAREDGRRMPFERAVEEVRGVFSPDRS